MKKTNGWMVKIIATWIVSTVLLSGNLRAEDAEIQVKGPYEFRNLAVYLIQGKDRLPAGVKIQTLEEAMAAKTTVVNETGSVNSLTVQNNHKDNYVFVFPGDIVKGGKQDRTLPNGFLMTPRSGETPVNSFCVEQGRWSKRPGESVAAFSSSQKTLVGKGLKLASKVGKSQGGVWENVAKTQTKLSRNVGNDVTAKISKTSLQLTLENKDLEKTISSYIRKIQAEAQGNVSNSIGIAFAINGKINSADIFVSRDLFGKLWPKLLESAATEAVGELEKNSKQNPPAPARNSVSKLLAEAETSKPTQEKIAGGNILLYHEKPGSLTFDTHGTVNGKELRIHRNVLTVTKAELAEFKKVKSSTMRQTRNPNSISILNNQASSPNQSQSSNGNVSKAAPIKKRNFLQKLLGRRR